jgi:lysozyme
MAGTSFKLKTSHKVTGAAVGVLMLAVPAVSQWEGLWTTAKPDKLAYNVPTVCYGETEGVKVGDTYTKEECQAMLALKLQDKYLTAVNKCVKVPISDRTRAAYLTLTYNIGTGGFCKSQVVKLVNAGQPVASCNAMLSWNRAGGKVVKGLQNRRKFERDMCFAGLIEPKRTL